MKPFDTARRRGSRGWLGWLLLILLLVLVVGAGVLAFTEVPSPVRHIEVPVASDRTPA